MEGYYTGPAFSPTPAMCLWTCHMCGRRWPMATRTCLQLDCGHRRCTRGEGQPTFAPFCPVQLGVTGGQANFPWRRPVERPALGGFCQAARSPVSAAKMKDQASRGEEDSAGPSERRMRLPIRTKPRPAASVASTIPAGQSSSAASAAAAPPPTRRPLPSLPPSSPAPAVATSSQFLIRYPLTRCRTGRVSKPSPLNPAWKPADKLL